MVVNTNLLPAESDPKVAQYARALVFAVSCLNPKVLGSAVWNLNVFLTRKCHKFQVVHIMQNNYLGLHWACSDRQAIILDVQLVWDGHRWVEENVILTIGQILGDKNKNAKPFHP